MPESLQPLKMYGYMSKETYIYMKRDLYITKKDLWKTHWCPSLDTLWKSMDIYQKRLVYIWKETNVLRKKTCENPIDAQVCTFSENLWIYIKRDLYIYEISRETYTYMKTDLYNMKTDLWNPHWCPSLDTLWKSMDIYQKRLIHIWKETYMIWKETCENPIDARVSTLSDNLLRHIHI